MFGPVTRAFIEDANMVEGDAEYLMSRVVRASHR
jgi:hypothetical protein